MADYTKVKPGDPLKITADQFNGWQDARQDTATDLKMNGRAAQGKQRQTGAILVQNISGQSIPAFNILTLKEPLTVPASGSAVDANDTATTTFTGRVVMTADTPASADSGSWCVLTEPLEDQAVGWAVVSGICPCRVNIAAAADKSVDVDDGETVPKSGDTGQLLIWVAGGVGTASTTGEQWAYVLLGGGGAAKLSKGTLKDQVYQMTSQNQTGWDYPKAGAM